MCSAARIADRRNFVFHKGIVIQRQPLSESGKTPAEIEGGASVARIKARAKGVAGGKEGMLYRTDRDRKIRPAKQAGAANTKFKIGCGLKVDLKAVDHRLL